MGTLVDRLRERGRFEGMTPERIERYLDGYFEGYLVGAVEGCTEGLVAFLAHKLGEPTHRVRERLTNRAIEWLDIFTRRVVFAEKLDDIFPDV